MDQPAVWGRSECRDCKRSEVAALLLVELQKQESRAQSYQPQTEHDDDDDDEDSYSWLTVHSADQKVDSILHLCGHFGLIQEVNEGRDGLGLKTLVFSALIQLRKAEEQWSSNPEQTHQHLQSREAEKMFLLGKDLWPSGWGQTSTVPFPPGDPERLLPPEHPGASWTDSGGSTWEDLWAASGETPSCWSLQKIRDEQNHWMKTMKMSSCLIYTTQKQKDFKNSLKLAS